jgi:addiction module RelE/StbE family toxin
MEIYFHRNFKKSILKQPKKIQTNFKDKFRVFQNDQFHYSLNNHALSGKFKGFRSFDVTGDVRVHYYENKNRIVFVKIGTHAQLYK